MQMKQTLWTKWDALIIIVAFLVIYGLSIPLQFGVAALTGELAAFKNSVNSSIPESALLINHIGKALGLLGGVFYVGRYRKRYTWAEMGFQPTTSRWIMISVIIAVVMFPARLILAKGLVAILPEYQIGAAGVFLNNSYSPLYNMLLLGIITILVPISEEMFYRGFLFTWFRDRRPLWAAVLFSSIIFGVSHIIPIQVVMSILMSIIITLVFVKSRSLWNAIIMHSVTNFVSAVVAFYLTSLW